MSAVGRLSALRAALYGPRTSAGKGGEKALREREWHVQSGEAQQALPELGAGKPLGLRVCLGGGGTRKATRPRKGGWATGWRRTSKSIFSSTCTGNSRTRKIRQILGDSSFNCCRIWVTAELGGGGDCLSLTQAAQGSPAACEHRERSKVNK